MTEPLVKGIAFASLYVSDFGESYEFYSGVLGLEKLYDMGTAACFFALSDDTGLYLQGGNEPVDYHPDTQRAAFVFAVRSAGELYAKLQAAGVQFVHDAPMHMGGDEYWFQFYDPAGNIVEALGPK